MMKSFATTLVLLFAISLSCNAQSIKLNTKNTEVDYERMEKIDGLVNDDSKKNWVKGAVSIVIKDNQVVQ